MRCRRPDAVGLEPLALAIFVGLSPAQAHELLLGQAAVLGTFDSAGHIDSFGRTKTQI